MTSAHRAATTDSTPLQRRASWRAHALALALAMAASLWGAAAASALSITEYSTDITPSSQPSHIAPGPGGEVWFTASVGARVGHITATGPQIGTVTEFAAGTAPSEIVQGSDGNMWYVKTTPAGGVVKVTPAGATTEIVTPGIVPQGAIAAGLDGNLWFTATVPIAGGGTAPGIVRMTIDGTIASFNTNIRATALLQDIARGPDGNMWFTERNAFGAVGKITPGGLITEYKTGITLNSNPHEIAAGPDGALWFTEFGSGKIGRITTTGLVTNHFSAITAASEPTGIVLGPDDNLWFTERAARKIARITSAGVVTEYSAGLSADSSPTAITTGPNSTLWFADSQGSRIGRVTIFELPTATTSDATAVTPTSATLNGMVNANGAATTAHFEYGTSLDYGTSTATVNFSGTTATAITADLPGLAADTTYYFKLVATNSYATSTSTGSFFKTAAPPTVTTGAATAIAPTSATLNGTVDAKGANAAVHFEYGKTLTYGTSTTPETITGTTAKPVTAALANLDPDTTYYFKLSATNAHGTTESTGSFKTIPTPLPPTVTVGAATAITTTSATLNGTVDAKGAATSAHFDVGLTADYGRSTIDQSVPGDGAKPISASLINLTENTTYQFRLVATSANGTTRVTGTFTTASIAAPAAATPPPPPAEETPPATVAPAAVTPPPPPATQRYAVPASVALDAKACPLVGTAIVGTDAPDTRGGTSATDLIFGLSGNDVLRGMAGADCLFGQAGADHLFGGAGADTLRGGDGADVLQGDAGDDALDGDAGNDQLTGGKGDDSLLGGSGDDHLTDRFGVDELKGGAGKDRIDARDTSAAGRRTADDVSCGAGLGDIALVDRRDRVARDCERVLRR